MAPGIALDDFPYGCGRHGVRIGKLLDAGAFPVGFAYGPHLLGGQPGAARAFAARLAMLCHLVGDVGSMGAEKEMVWIHAGGIIAFRTVMQDIQSIGYGSEGQGPGHTMGTRASACAAESDQAIPVAVTRAAPQPTRVFVSTRWRHGAIP